MEHLFVQKQYETRRLGAYVLLSLCALLLGCNLGAWAQSTAPAGTGTPFSLRATHLLGFPNTKSNCNGILSIKEDTLQFQQAAKPTAEVKIPSIQGVFLGGESKQVGGVPVKMGKAAAPFGSGRVISLFAHRKYDTLTVEYVDSDGGVHGAIFQLNKGEAELVKNELVTRGVSPNVARDQSTEHSTAEVSHENK
jgi:hypothetical protein